MVSTAVRKRLSQPPAGLGLGLGLSLAISDESKTETMLEKRYTFVNTIKFRILLQTYFSGMRNFIKILTGSKPPGQRGLS